MSELSKRQTEWVELHEAGLKGLEGVSIGGSCPGCPECMEADGYESKEAHEADWGSKDMPSDEASFSWRSCGICGCNLGGDRHTWHYIVPDETGSCKGRQIYHEEDACSDCMFFHANGDVPEDEYLDWID